jgi:pyruvate dehydrogenase E2 component (dihydrolipoamide acetyltransferase)
VAFEFRLPDIGEGIHEGEIVKWFVSAGDTIEEDDVLAEVQNDKASGASILTMTSPTTATVPSSTTTSSIVPLTGDGIVSAGDTIEEDDVLAEVQNDKSVVEIPSPVSGTIEEVVVDCISG